MNGIVAYDSILGNTRKVAEQMAIEMRANGHTVRLINLATEEAGEVKGDFLLIGSPNRMKRISSMAKRFIRHLDGDEWKGKKVVVFDTVLQVLDDPNKTEKQMAKARKWAYEGAAPKMSRKLDKKGIVCSGVWHFEVSGLKDPLVPGWEEKVRERLASLDPQNTFTVS
ncbi:MAG TPA: flavodoxin domain-containing protein [Methanomassiliicoccales archaeon]|jgi:flavodoxin